MVRSNQGSERGKRGPPMKRIGEKEGGVRVSLWTGEKLGKKERDSKGAERQKRPKKLGTAKDRLLASAKGLYDARVMSDCSDC